MEADAEQRPLLGHPSPDRADAPSPPDNHAARRSILVIFLCALIIFTFSVASAVQLTPMTQIMEKIICQRYARQVSAGYALSLTEEDKCKAPSVQSELSIVQAWLNTLDAIPGLLVAVPYGALADKYSHKAMLQLSSIGILLQTISQILICAYPAVFPLRLLWVTPIVTLIGGGTAVLIPMLYAIVNSVSSEAQRSTAFFYMGAAAHAGMLVSNPLAYVTMEVDEWLPIYIGLGCMALATGLSFLTPDTTVRRKTSPHRHVPNPEPQSAASSSTSGSRAAFSQWVRHAVDKAGAAVQWLVRDHKSVALLLLTMLLTTLGRYASLLELQYITKRYGWSWSEAGLLLSARALTSLLLFTIVLPLVGNLLLLRGRLAPAKDLWMARASLLCLAVGAIGVGAAQTRAAVAVGIIVLASGSGYAFLARSIMSSLVVAEHIGLLYTVIGIFEALGSLVAGPLLAQLFSVGLGWGGSWVGLPFFATGLMSIACLVIVGFVRLQPPAEVRASSPIGEDRSD